MTIKCASCKYQIIISREEFVDIFLACEFDSEEETEKHFDDPCRSETDKVFDVLITEECTDFTKRTSLEPKRVVRERR
jgi:isocitrate dehydrogenase